MNPIPVPDQVKDGRPECAVVPIGPPRGVSDDECGTVEMLVSPREEVFPGVVGRRQYAYFRPTPEELETLNNGSVIEYVQYGVGVQPFGAAVWAL